MGTESGGGFNMFQPETLGPMLKKSLGDGAVSSFFTDLLSQRGRGFNRDGNGNSLKSEKMGGANKPPTAPTPSTVPTAGAGSDFFKPMDTAGRNQLVQTMMARARGGSMPGVASGAPGGVAGGAPPGPVGTQPPVGAPPPGIPPNLGQYAAMPFPKAIIR
jgi:hypothetical protein